MISYTIYILTGVVLWGALLASSRYFSRTALSPYSIYMSVLLLHMFIDPAFRHSIGVIPDSNWSVISSMNLVCYIAAFLGCALGIVLFRPIKLAGRIIDRGLISGRQKTFFLYIITASLLVLAFLLLIVSGAANSTRGIYSGYGSAALSYTLANFIVGYILSSVTIFALFSIMEKSLELKMKVLFLVPTFAVLLFNFLTFGRQASLTLLTTLVIVIVAVVPRIPPRAIFFGFIGFALISAVGSFRSLNMGISEIPLSQMLDHISEKLLFFMVTTIPGQEVFGIAATRFGSVSDQFFSGATYFYNLLIAMRLGFLTPEDYQTPAYWFASNFLGENSYGRDFSMVAEAYINFGYWGAGVFFFLGLAVVWFSRVLYRTTSLIVAAWAAFMIVNLIIGLRNDSLPVFSRAIFSFLPIVIYHYTYKALAIATLRRS